MRFSLNIGTSFDVTEPMCFDMLISLGVERVVGKILNKFSDIIGIVVVVLATRTHGCLGP